MADEWESVLAEKDFKSLSTQDKVKVAHNFFQANIATEKDFQQLDQSKQGIVKSNFYKTLQEEAPFEARYPNLSATIKTIQGTPRTIAAGMTLGASEKIREKIVGKKDPEPYSDIPETSRMVGEFAGAAAPISAVGGAITTGVKAIAPKLGVMGANKFFDPAAKIVSWAVAGAGYGAAEKGIKKGELPTLKELGTDAALWGGTEAIINSLGWGGRMAAAVNNLSKAYAVPRKEVLKSVFNQAKETGSPIIEIASQKQAAQEALKAIEEAKTTSKEVPSPDTVVGHIHDTADEFVKKVESLVGAQRGKHQRGYEALRRDLSIEESGVGLDFQSMTPEQRIEAVTQQNQVSGTPQSMRSRDESFMPPEMVQRVEQRTVPETSEEGGAFVYRDATVRDNAIRKQTMLPEESVTKTGGLFGQQHLGGVVAGINPDDNGTLQYDPMLGLAGMAAGVIAMRSRSKQKHADAKANPTDSEKVAGMFQRTDETIQKRNSWDSQKVKDFMVRAFVDVSGKAKSMVKSVDSRAGREIEMLKNAVAGASSNAARRIDNFNEQIYRGTTRKEEEIIDNIVNAKRNIAISGYKPNVKHQEGLTGDQFQTYLDDLMAGKNTNGLSPKQIEEAFKRADIVFGSHKLNTDKLLEKGIIDETQHEALTEHIYSPRRYFQHLDELDKSISGRSISSGDAGIKALDEGSIGLMEKRSKLLLSQTTARTEDLIARNEANMGLLKLADTHPGNAVVRRAEVTRTTNDGAPVYETAGRGEGKISVLENGKRVEMIVPQEFEKSWVKSDPLINSTLSQALQWVSGAKILKMGATGINPAFALTNMPRDIAMVWTGGQYSRTLPIAAGQFAKDFTATAKDTFLRRGRAIDYVKEGGGMEFLTYYGKGGGHIASGIGKSLDSLGKIMGWVGETSEIWTRLAHRERALNNLTSDFKGKNKRLPNADEQKALQFEATQIAREGGIDFSQGGNFIKAIDNVIPYLNASIQGTRTIARNAKNAPAAFTYQMAQLAGVAAGLHVWNQHNPEAWRQISDRDKESNFCIVVPDILPGATSYTDDKGQKRYRFIKIAKDQGHRIFISPIEAAMEFKETGKIPTKQIFQAITDLGVNFNIPILSAITAIAGNVDDYQWEQIWKGARDIKPEEEYRADTPKGYVAAGQATGLSPTRLQAGINKIIPASNPFVGAVGEVIQMATGKTGEALQKKGWNQFISENQAVRRILSSTSPSTEYRDTIHEAQTEANTENFKQNRTLDELSDKFFRSKDQKEGQKVSQYIASQPEKDQDRLAKRYTESYELKDYPDRDFWKSVKHATPEVRAQILYQKVMDSKPEKRQAVIDTANDIKGIITERVIEKYTELMNSKKSVGTRETQGKQKVWE